MIRFLVFLAAVGLLEGPQFIYCQGKDQPKVDEPGAKWMRSPHMNSGRKGLGFAKYLIIHGTGGGSSAENIAAGFQNPKRPQKASTHYIVDQQGAVVQCVREKDTAWGNGGVEPGADPWWTGTRPNTLTISIEHVKSNLNNSNELTQPQKEASFKLIKNILARNPNIKPIWADASGGITGHFSMSPKSKARCPGPFPWNEMFEAIGGSGNSCFGTVITSESLRSAPDPKSKVVKNLYFGHTLKIEEKVIGEDVGGNTGWFRTAQGYISANYVDIIDDPRKPKWCLK